MQRLRSTFKRSRTPTGAEMKSQSSLEVPKQVRSASFDEIQLEAKRHDEAKEKIRSKAYEAYHSSSCSSSSGSSSYHMTSRVHQQVLQESSGAVRRLATLRVPQLQSGQRSKSFDACGSDSRRNAGTPGLPLFQVSGCYHCACVEEFKRLQQRKEDASDSPSSSPGTGSTEDIDSDDIAGQEDDEDTEDDDLDGDDGSDDQNRSREREQSPEIRVTLMPSERFANLVTRNQISRASPQPQNQNQLQPQQRRRSIASPKLSRQEALTSFPVELPFILGTEEEQAEEHPDEDEHGDERGKLVVRDIFLAVPELKRDRAASVDSCFNNNKTDKGDNEDSLGVTQQSIRSKSVDIVLPTEAQTRYTALLPGNESHPLRGWVRRMCFAHLEVRRARG